MAVADEGSSSIDQLMGNSQPCVRQRFQLDQRVIGARCEETVQGKTVIIKFPEMKLITFCEVEVFGYLEGENLKLQEEVLLICFEDR